MGFLADSFRFGAFEQKAQAIAATITPWDTTTKPNYASYDHNAREGYMVDELVYDCVEFRADSAGEPPLVAWQVTDAGEEKISSTQHSRC
jgi:hypothetical protein